MATQVPEQDPRNQYTATAGQTIFAYAFLTYDENEILVTQNGVQLVITVNYTVSGLGVLTGGNITLVSGASAGDLITIERNMELKRDIDYQNAGDFLADTVNLDFNRLWMSMQEVSTATALALQLDATDDFTGTDSPFYLPSKSLRASKGLGFDVSGNPIAIDVVAGGSSSASQINYTNLLSVVESVQDGIARNELKTRNAFLFATDSGTADNYVLTESTGITPTAYYVGGSIAFTPINANTGASVANLNSLGSLSLLTSDGSALPSGFLDPTRGVYTFIYTGFDLRFYGCSTVFADYIGDNQILLPKIVQGTPGYKISYDASGDAEETPDLKWVEHSTIDLTNGGANDTGAWTFGSIPTCDKIEIDIFGQSMSDSSKTAITIGDSGGLEVTGYTGGSRNIATTVTSTAPTTLWHLNASTNAAAVWGGKVILSKVSGNDWICSCTYIDSGGAINLGGGSKSLSDTLTQVQLKSSVSGLFDGGTATLRYYGNPEV